MVEKSGKFTDLRARVATAMGLAVITGGVLWLGGVWVAGFLSLVVVILLLEFRYIVRGELMPSELGLWIMLVTGVGAVMLTHFYGWLWGMILILAGCAALVQRNRQEWGWLAAGLAYITTAVTLAQALASQVEGGVGLLIWVVLVVAAADIGAYFTGRAVGGPKFWPRISPKKTWSGVVGGWVGAVVVGAVFGLFGSQTVGTMMVLSFVLAVASQGGDLLESWLKRRHNIKDAGFILPGHGGLLDRVDGLMAALVVNGFLLLLLK